jgi:hypothetical protein
LIGLYSGYDKYAEMLEMTAPVNKAYARKWNQDLVVLQGTSYIREIDKNCTPPGRRVTLSKIALLLRALERKDDYDQFLLLDTDALMYDFETDVTTLLSDEDMVAAERVKTHDVNRTWNINAGVMLWNLHHPLSKIVIRAWKRLALRTVDEDDFRGDQQPLQKILKQGTIREQVSSVWEEFAYGHGTVVKHFIRSTKHNDWKDPNLVETRMPRMKQAIADVCQKYPALCDQIERVKYATS